MMRILLMFCLLIGIFEGSPAQENSDTASVKKITLESPEYISNDFLSDYYLHYTLDHILENYYHFTYYQVETTGDFSHPNPYVFSYTGYSYQWNRYYFGQHRFNDLYFPGTSLYKPFLIDKSLNLDMVNSSVQFLQQPPKQNRVFAQFNNGHMGGRIPLADEYIRFFHGHPSAFESTYVPIAERKRIENNGLAYFNTSIGKYPLSGFFNIGSREHTGFNFDGIDEVFSEGYAQFMLNGELPAFAGRLFDTNSFMLGYNQRDHLNAECYFDRQETAEYNNFNFSFYGDKYLGKDHRYGTGINFSYKKIDHVNPGFSRNVIDQDGEGMEPWYPSAEVFEVSHSYQHTLPLSFLPNTNLHLESFNGLIRQNPLQETYSNPIFFQEAEDQFTSLYVANWESEEFSAGILENKVGLAWEKKPTDKINLRAGVDLTFDGFLLENNSHTNFSAQIDLNADYQFTRVFSVAANLGRRRVPFHFDQVRFLSDDYFSGEWFFWNDENQDREFQAGETGELFKTSGGRYHELSDEVKQPSINYLDVSLNFDLSKNWTILVTNQYRQFRNTWTVEYDEPISELGQFTTRAGDEVFFLDGGQPINYKVVPFKTELMERAAERQLGYLFKNPFYAGSTLQVKKEANRYFFSMTFVGYMVVGFGPIGNGVLHNSVGVLSETLANPNTYIDYLGRYDADRAFIIKGLFSRKITDALTLAVLVNWKDGQPINLFEREIISQSGNNQFLIWNENIKGINPFTGQFGSRESAYWNYDFRLHYKVTLGDNPLNLQATVYNAFDVATTLSNFSFSPEEPGQRFVMDVQIPRGFMLSTELLF